MTGKQSRPVEGAENFSKFQKGEGCLAIRGPETAAIECLRREGSDIDG
jgi:hypothetical protein